MNIYPIHLPLIFLLIILLIYYGLIKYIFVNILKTKLNQVHYIQLNLVFYHYNLKIVMLLNLKSSLPFLFELNNLNK